MLDCPPNGVDLAALGDGATHLVTPEEGSRMYQEASEAAGGNEALRAAAEISKKLRAQLVGPEASQMEVWQSYDLRFMMERAGAGSRVRDYGVRTLQCLASELRESVHPDAQLEIPDVKRWGRASVKTRIKYALDCSKLCDLNRVTLACPNIHVMYAAVEYIFGRWGPLARSESVRVVDFQDRYQEPMPGGYRHVQVMVLLSGVVWEVQLNTVPMLEAKHNAGHKLYKTTRFVQEMLLLICMEGNMDAFHSLLSWQGVKSVADPNAVADKNGLTALHHAAFRGDIDILELLLDGRLISEPADPWALDTTPSGGLPLNYAAQMRHWELVENLLRWMVKSPLPPGGLSLEARDRLAAACAVAVDAYEEVPHILPAFLEVWGVAGIDPRWRGLNPFGYAVQVKAEPALELIVGFVDVWEVDHTGRLPVEALLRADLRRSAEATAARMLAAWPFSIGSAAAWSLAHCRGANLPGLDEDLLANALRLQRRFYTCGTQAAAPTTHTMQQLDALSLEQLCTVPLRARYCCFALDDDFLYAGSADGSIHKFDVREGTPSLAAEWSGHHQLITCLLLGSKRPSFDGTLRVRRLFSGSTDDHVRVWDLHKGRCVSVLKHRSDICSLARLGPFLFVAAKDVIVLWNVQKIGGMERRGELRGHKGRIDDLLVVGHRLFSCGSDGDIRSWDKNGGELDTLRHHRDGLRVCRLAPGPDGGIFSAAYHDRSRAPSPAPGATARPYRSPSIDGDQAQVCAWSATGELLSTWSMPFPVVRLFAVKTILFVADCCGWVRLCDSKTGEAVSKIRIHEELCAFVIDIRSPAGAATTKEPGSDNSDTDAASDSSGTGKALRTWSAHSSGGSSARLKPSEARRKHTSAGVSRPTSRASAPASVACPG